MKKLMLTALAVVSFTFANAQDGTTGEGFAKGDIFISGAVGYNSSESGDFEIKTFTISPRAGYFVSENIAIGARIGYQSNKQENGTTELDTNTFNAGAFGRYYFTPASKFSIFGEFGVDYLSSKTDNGTTDTTADGFSLGGGPGLSYFISNNFALETFWGALRYTSVKPEGADDSNNNFNFGADLDNITLGLVYKF